MKVVVLFSGGIDSTVVLRLMEQHERLPLAFDYQQPHSIELERAGMICHEQGLLLNVMKLPKMPKINDVVFAGRNAVFLSLAAGFALENGAEKVVIGCNASDHERFPDCRPRFIESMNRALHAAYGVNVEAPLLMSDKRQIVSMADRLGIDLRATWSCYQPTDEGRPCGECLACQVRKDAGAPESRDW
jgi:7-cyano-7-deazaguanine synthase